MQLSKELFIKLKESVAFFASFTTGELVALLKLAKSETYNDGEVVFKENTRGDKMYIILNGTVRISKNIGNKKEEVLAKLTPGACFGEMGIIDHSPRSASAIVEGGTAVLLSIEEKLLSEHNLLLAYKLYRNFSVVLAERLRATTNKYQDAVAGDRNASSQVKTLLKKRLEKGGSLAGTNLKGADLSEVFMNNANLEESVLVNAKLSGIKCKGTNFSKAQLTNAQLEDIDFNDSNFEGSDFTAATFKEVSFNGCSFSGAKFLGAEMSDAQISQLPGDLESKPDIPNE